MSAFVGFVNAALKFGIQSFVIKPKRGIFNILSTDGSVFEDIIAQAVIEENHRDTLEITDHPVEQGAAITDHAFKLPAEVTLTLGWSNSPSQAGPLGFLSNLSNQSLMSTLTGNGIDQIKNVYANLLRLQEARALFSLYTGKRYYTNMLCQSLATSTDFKSENSLVITMVCKQIIIVETQTVMLNKETQRNPSQTASPVNKGTKQPVLKGGA